MNLNSEQLRDSFGSPTSRCLYWGNPRKEILFVFFEACDARDTLLILQGDAQLETTLTVPGKAHFSWKGNSHPHKTTRLFCFSSVKSKSSVAKLTEELTGMAVSCLSSRSDFPQTGRKGFLTPDSSWCAKNAFGFAGRGEDLAPRGTSGAHHQAHRFSKKTPLSEGRAWPVPGLVAWECWGPSSSQQETPRRLSQDPGSIQERWNSKS